jgi:bla regulator protein blaR1
MRIAVLTAVATVLLRIGQTSTPPKPAVFEVASVKQNREGGSVAGLRRIPGGRFEATNIQLASLISFAYQLQPFELVGGPAWLMDDRWDVVAKIDGDPPPAPPGTIDEMMMATQALLADRFKLAVHRETREIPVYQLVRSNRDGTLGKGMKPSAVDCLAIQRAADEAAKGGPPAPNPNTPDRVVCGLRISVGRIQFGGRPLLVLTNGLTAITQRRVVDRTGLTGDWEFDISFTPPSIPPGMDVPPPDPDAASLFTVLQEQLGLKLEPARAPLPVTVVDRVERPVER